MSVGAWGPLAAGYVKMNVEIDSAGIHWDSSIEANWNIQSGELTCISPGSPVNDGGWFFLNRTIDFTKVSKVRFYAVRKYMYQYSTFKIAFSKDKNKGSYVSETWRDDDVTTGWMEYDTTALTGHYIFGFWNGCSRYPSGVAGDVRIREIILLS